MSFLPDIMELPYLPPANLLEHWPESLPLLFLGGQGSQYALLACSFYEVSLEDLKALPLQAYPQRKSLLAQNLPFVSGYWGLVPYSYWEQERAPLPLSSEANAPSVTQPAPKKATPSCFRIKRALIFDLYSRRLFATAQRQEDPNLTLTARSPLYELPSSLWKRLHRGKLAHSVSTEAVKVNTPKTPKTQNLSLRPHTCAAHYLAQCAAAIEEIRQGRYYQINLLRYFSLAQTSLTRQDLLGHFWENAGPYGSIFAAPTASQVYSFSPERFVHLKPEAASLRAFTYPIKGTAARVADPKLDAEIKRTLRHSAKDLAELHMIIDLMRNDLQKLSLPGSVKVLFAQKLISLKSVHHLQGCISSVLKANLSFGEFLANLCPAGSITGAPKIEVMQAIAQHEQRSRGYFMGTAFYWDDSGSFDSSVLIRSLSVNPHTEPRYEYAAGSGIVIHSSPERELAEITAKCRVIGRVEEELTTLTN